MALSADAYAAQLRALLPLGPLWAALRRGPTVLGLLLAWGRGLSRFQTDAELLQREADPRFTTALLPEWEASVGLPDGCLGGGGSTQQRRDAVVARVRAQGGCHLDYFQGIAISLGYVGTVAADIGVHRWRLTVPGVAVREMTCNDTCTDALRSWDTGSLECVINRYKPAHTEVVFSYGA